MQLAFIKTKNINIYQIIANPTKENIRENSEILKIERRNDINKTEKLRLIKSRVGQGVYRNNLMQIENKCRVTGLADFNYLIASHIKPWSHSSDNEKLDSNNGLFLSPHIDKLFDNGYIGFSSSGSIIISSKLNTRVLELWNIDKGLNVGVFNKQQQKHLEYHRANILKK
jgi:predicted restriction endonuclease